jgi:integrase/recombinase XerD
MLKLSFRSSKRKSKKLKRVAISPKHAHNICRLRTASTPLRKRFLEDMDLHKFSPLTQERYLSAAIHFCAYYWKSPDVITDAEIRSYLNYQMNERHLGNGSLGIIHGSLKFLYEKTLRLERPALSLFRTKKDHPEKVILSQAEVRAALEYVRDQRFRAALELIYCCGLREAEALRLTVADIDRPRGLLTIFGKGDKTRMVPIPGLMLEKLTALWKSHRHPELLFPAYKPRSPGRPRSGVLDCPIPGQTLLSAWKKAVQSSGCKKAVNVHTLRHCYGTHLLEEGAPIEVVKNNLGHSSVRTTAVYTHHTSRLRRQGADAVEKLTNNLSR